jgi:FKBP-type peptidyl-prolyl cis-trans isomerase FklB
MKSVISVLLGLSLISVTAYADMNNTNQGSSSSMQSVEVKNQAAGEAFLLANKKKPGVITLPSGLQYKIIKAGTGPMPTGEDIVTVNYEGKLIDGTEFDSSYKRGQPATFPVSGVIAGWTEALKLMKAGSEWELYIPASLAYGTQGAQPVIGPNEVLVFKVDLINVKKQ